MSRRRSADRDRLRLAAERHPHAGDSGRAPRPSRPGTSAILHERTPPARPPRHLPAMRHPCSPSTHTPTSSRPTPIPIPHTFWRPPLHLVPGTAHRHRRSLRAADAAAVDHLVVVQASDAAPDSTTATSPTSSPGTTTASAGSPRWTSSPRRWSTTSTLDRRARLPGVRIRAADGTTAVPTPGRGLDDERMAPVWQFLSDRRVRPPSRCTPSTLRSSPGSSSSTRDSPRSSTTRAGPGWTTPRRTRAPPEFPSSRRPPGSSSSSRRRPSCAHSAKRIRGTGGPHADREVRRSQRHVGFEFPRLGRTVVRVTTSSRRNCPRSTTTELELIAGGTAGGRTG